ncbi:TetR/AcrR family transcriptional regulator [Rhodococcus koreensis]|uniref:TetR/AcrR family transcriptional regulator n=1 Tax=Rhodococcus koreensis TaxID=99653 RepID=UPI0036719359
MASTTRSPRGPTDRERASRIARATIDVLRQGGLAGLTHRAVARQADVPLGSTTYHYANRQALLEAAIRVGIAEFEELIAQWAVGLDANNVASRLATLIATQSFPGEARDGILVEYELYLASARTVDLRPLSHQWDAVLRTVLEDRVGKSAGRVYFAAYVGLMFESLISDEPLDQAEVERILGAIVPD